MNLFYKFKIIIELFNVFKEVSFKGLVLYVCFKIKLKIPLIFNQDNTKKKIAVIGTGTYQVSFNIPSAMKSNFYISGVTTNGSSSASNLANLFQNTKTFKNLQSLYNDTNYSALLIGSPHYLHPEHINFFIKKNIYIYCEKPVAIDMKGINYLYKNVMSNKNKKKIMIGFNRRYAPLIKILKQKSCFNKNKVIEISYRVNFGKFIDNDLTKSNIGGGRLIGSCCHYVDLISYIADSEIIEVSAFGLIKKNIVSDNTFCAILKLKNGSIANLTFTSSGNRNFGPKEIIQITGNNHLATITDFHTLILDNKVYRSRRHNLGAIHIWKEFSQIVDCNEKTSITLDDGIKATLITLAIQKSLINNGQVQKVKNI